MRVHQPGGQGGVEAILLSHQDGGRDGHPGPCAPTRRAQGPSGGGGRQWWEVGRRRDARPGATALGTREGEAEAAGPSTPPQQPGVVRGEVTVQSLPEDGAHPGSPFLPSTRWSPPSFKARFTNPALYSPTPRTPPTHWTPRVGTQCQRRASGGRPAEDGGGTGEGPVGSRGSSGHVRGLDEARRLPHQTEALPPWACEAPERSGAHLRGRPGGHPQPQQGASGGLVPAWRRKCSEARYVYRYTGLQYMLFARRHRSCVGADAAGALGGWRGA